MGGSGPLVMESNSLHLLLISLFLGIYKDGAANLDNCIDHL